METIVPTEIDMPTLLTDIPEQSNIEYVIKDLDMADELGEATDVRIAPYHCKLAPIQQTRETPNVSSRGPSPEKSFREHNRSVSRKVLDKPGGTVYYNTGQ